MSMQLVLPLSLVKVKLHNYTWQLISKFTAIDYSIHPFPCQCDVPTQSLRSSSLSLCVPNWKTGMAKSKSFSSVASSVWNKLPGHLSSISTLPAFRKRLKHHLFLMPFSVIPHHPLGCPKSKRIMCKIRAMRKFWVHVQTALFTELENLDHSKHYFLIIWYVYWNNFLYDFIYYSFCCLKTWMFEDL